MYNTYVWNEEPYFQFKIPYLLCNNFASFDMLYIYNTKHVHTEFINILGSQNFGHIMMMKKKYNNNNIIIMKSLGNMKQI